MPVNVCFFISSSLALTHLLPQALQTLDHFNAENVQVIGKKPWLNVFRHNSLNNVCTGSTEKSQ